MRRYLILFLALFALAGCDTTQWIANFMAGGAEAPPAQRVGDAVRGEDIFRHGINTAPPCISCHGLVPGVYALAPVMQGFAERAGSRVEGLTADAYTHQSILDPGAYLVPGFRNIMYPLYADDLTDQDVTDLIAFLMTL